MFPVVSPPIFQIIIRKYLKNGAASGTEWSEPTREKFGKCLCLFGIFQVPLHIVYFIDFRKNRKRLCPTTQNCALQHCVVGVRPFSCFAKRHTHFPFFTGNLHFRSIFQKTGNFLCPMGQRYFPFWSYKIQPQKGALTVCHTPASLNRFRTKRRF